MYFTVTYGQFNASLLNQNINFFKKNQKFELYCIIEISYLYILSAVNLFD